jgi:protein-export membrane protein SecD
MTKAKAVVKFCVIGVLVLIGLTLCFVSFRPIPFTETDFNSFYDAIKGKMGIDLNGGVLAVFDVTADDGSKDLGKEVDATMRRIEDMLSAKNYTEATVMKQGTYPNYKIRIEVPGMDNTEEIFEAIGTPANIQFTAPVSSAVSSGSDIGSNVPFLDGKGLAKVEVVADGTGYAIKLTFTAEGKAEFRKQVTEGGTNGGNAGGMYLPIYSNGKAISSPQITSTDVDKLGSDGTVLITGDYTKESADNFALQIESGLYSVKLSASETSIIPATAGEGALLAGIIALLAGLVFIFFLMWLRYRDLGLLSNLSLLVYTILFLFFLAVIDAVQLTLPGIAGIILSIAMAVDANVLIFEQIKEEYKSGKRFASAVESGFNKSVRTILDANITTIIASVILYIFGTGAIKGFAITLFLGVAISMFAGLVITRGLAKLYLYINPDNALRANFRDVNIPADSQKAEAAVSVKTKRKLNLGGGK